MDFKSLLELKREILDPLFSGAPAWLQALLPLLIVVIIAASIWKILREPAKDLVQLVLQLRASAEEREIIRLRQRFAHYLRLKLARLEQEESWNQRRFTELEAEYYPGLEITGPRWKRLFASVSRGPRRRKTLSRALVNSVDTFALLEGDPGSGKSIVLRKVAFDVCSDAAVSWKRVTPVALYVNLKMLDRPTGIAVDQNFIRAFVVEQLKKASNPEFNRYIDDEFQRVVTEGRWVFLFDSFDEIPDVLSAEDVSDTIEAYANAIFEFAITFTGCRTILATRYFRRPRQSALPKYRILPLSDSQRDTLIRRASLSPAAGQRLYDGIGTAEGGMRYLMENPMYLGLLIEYIRDGESCPGNPHHLFARFIDKKLSTNAELLRSRYLTDPGRLREFAELIAYTIVEDVNLGLNPKRKDLIRAAFRTQPSNHNLTQQLLDALEHLGFGRGESDAEQREDARFTFSHRRFQEYFATSYVLRVPEAVTDNQVLFDARWRETAAVLLSATAEPRIRILLSAADEILKRSIATLESERLCYHSGLDSTPTFGSKSPDFFPWPSQSLQLIGLLQDGFAEDPGRLPDQHRQDMATIIHSAFAYGRLADRQLGLEVAGCLRNDELLPLLRSAMTFGSQILDDAVFRQARRLTQVPADLSRWIRLTLFRRAVSGRLYRERRTILAFLSRVRDGGELLASGRLLSRLGQIDLALHVCYVALLLLNPDSNFERKFLFTVVAVSAASRPLVWYMFHRLNVKVGVLGVRTPRNAFFRWLQPVKPANLPSYLAFVAIFWLLSLRLFLPLTLFIPTFTGLELAWLVVGGWAPMAAVAALTGRLTEIPWWPVLTFFPLLFVIRSPVTAGWMVKEHFARWTPVYATLLILYLFLHILSKVPAVQESALPMFLTLFAGLAGFYAIFVLGILLQVVHWIADWQRFRGFQHAEGVLAINDFIEGLHAYYFNSFRVRFIRLVAARMYLSFTRHTLDTVKNLTLVLERELTQRSNNLQKLSLIQLRNMFTFGRRHDVMMLWDTAVLDELWRLEQRLAELYSAQSSKEPSPAAVAPNPS